MNIFDQISRRFDPYRQKIFVETNRSRRYIEKRKRKKPKAKENQTKTKRKAKSLQKTDVNREMTACASKSTSGIGKDCSSNRLWEFQKAESGIKAGRRLEKWGNRSKGVPKSRVICVL
nr:hypothetical protein [uncultured Acetatifactor sp.]